MSESLVGRVTRISTPMRNGSIFQFRRTRRSPQHGELAEKAANAYDRQRISESSRNTIFRTES